MSNYQNSIITGILLTSFIAFFITPTDFNESKAIYLKKFNQGENFINREPFFLAVGVMEYTEIAPPLNTKDNIQDLIKEKYPEEAEILIKLAQCESSLNPKAWNKRDPYGGAKGLFQFLEPTFYFYAKVYQIENPDIWSVEDQIELTAYLIQDNKLSLWTCGRKICN